MPDRSLGLLDGRQGFIIALMSAFGVFVKYAKLMELWIQHRKPKPGAAAHD